MDPLTQTENKRKFDDDVAAITAQTIPFPTPIACLQVDLDNFKQVNDRYGHQAGDDVLKHVVTTLRKKKRTRDRFYRTGGDEFMLLCPDLTASEAEGMVDRVRTELRERPIVLRAMQDAEHEPVVQGLSVGISVCNTGSELRARIEEADKAAYRSKEMGRNRTTIYCSEVSALNESDARETQR